MIQKSAVKKYIKEKGFRSSPETLEFLQKVICTILDSAMEVAKRDKRKTVQAQDFVEKIEPTHNDNQEG